MSSPSRSGAFESAVDQRVERFSESISFDHRLYRQDIRGSIAHASMLADQGILTHEECQLIVDHLTEIQSLVQLSALGGADKNYYLNADQGGRLQVNAPWYSPEYHRLLTEIDWDAVKLSCDLFGANENRVSETA